MRFSALQQWNASNLLTSAGAAFGFASVVLTHAQRFAAATTALCLAILCDRLDGALARRLSEVSDFGGELDSLADAISFVTAPALIAIFLKPGDLVVAVCALAYLLAGLWRLARFNVVGLNTSGPDPSFIGVPTTVAAAWFAIAWAGVQGSDMRLDSWRWGWAFGAFLLVLAVAMVSDVPVRKNGPLVTSLYLLLPGALAVVWVTAA